MCAWLTFLEFVESVKIEIEKENLGKQLPKTHPNTLTQTLPFGSYSTSPPRPVVSGFIPTYAIQLGVQ